MKRKPPTKSNVRKHAEKKSNNKKKPKKSNEKNRAGSTEHNVFSSLDWKGMRR